MATANTIAAGATVTVAYDKPTSNALADTANNEVADFTQTALPTVRHSPVVTLTVGIREAHRRRGSPRPTAGAPSR